MTEESDSPFDFDASCDNEASPEDELSWGDRMLQGPLTPRHKRLAELIAQGKRTSEIAREMGYTDSRVSILRSNSLIVAEVDRIRERIYEDTIGSWLRKMATPAQMEIEKCLTDTTREYKANLKVDTAKWLVEMNHGKAKQTSDIGENMLSVLMDKMDAIQGARGSGTPIDVTPPRLSSPSVEIEEIEIEKTEEDVLRDWVTDFSVSGGK